MSRADADLGGDPVFWWYADTLDMTRPEYDMLNEASQRCDMSMVDYIRQSALAAARNIVPPACQPSEASLVETPMPGLFDGKEGG